LLLISPDRFTSISLKALAKVGLLRPLGYYDASQSIAIALDSALFSDGQFVGPDTQDRFDAEQARLAATQTFAKAVAACKTQTDPGSALKTYLSAAAAGLDSASAAEPGHSFVAQLNLELARMARDAGREFDKEGADFVFSYASTLLDDTANVAIYK
jgi:hypothetical protein